MKIKLFLVISIILVTTSISATRFNIGTAAGISQLNDSYKSGTNVLLSGEFTSRTGLGLTFGSGVIQHPSDSNYEDLTTIPLTVGIKYYVTPKNPISIYMGVHTGIYLLSSGYDSSTFGFGGEAGFRFKIDRNTQLFMGARLDSYSDDTTSQDFSSTLYNVGVSFALGESKKNKQSMKRRKLEKELKSPRQIKRPRLKPRRTPGY